MDIQNWLKKKKRGNSHSFRVACDRATVSLLKSREYTISKQSVNNIYHRHTHCFWFSISPFVPLSLLTYSGVCPEITLCLLLLLLTSPACVFVCTRMCVCVCVCSISIINPSGARAGCKKTLCLLHYTHKISPFILFPAD